MSQSKDKNSIPKRKIRDLSELPAWYQLKKYDDAKNLDEVGWYEQLEIRKSFHGFFTDRYIQDFRSDSLYGQTMLGALASHRINPLREISPKETICIGGGALDAIKNDKDFFANAVNGITPIPVQDIYMIEHLFEPEFRARARAFYQDIFRDIDFSRENFDHEKVDWDFSQNFQFRPFYDFIERKSRFGQQYVRVDLGLPDKVLVSHFAAYLKNMRKIGKKNIRRTASSPI